jgi:DNA-binding transcriptional MerR regulator
VKPDVAEPESNNFADSGWRQRSWDPQRSDAVSVARDEIKEWRRRRVRDVMTSFAIDDLVRLLRECFGALRLDRSIASGVTVNTIHYYRRKDIIDPPSGNTASARYELVHLWQIAGARLSGHLGLATLAEARAAIRGNGEDEAFLYFAAQVAEARARTAVRSAKVDMGVDVVSEEGGTIRPLPGVGEPRATTSATVVALPGDAWCVVPAEHAAHRSPAAAEALARALVVALQASRPS